MKKVVSSFLIISCLSLVTPFSCLAASELISPTSPLYFLQTLKESVTYFLKFSKEQKVEYLLTLSDKRVKEITQVSGSKDTEVSQKLTLRYQNHFQKLEQLSQQVSNQEQASEKIKQASLRQQETLAEVYNLVSEQAKPAILKAQENSSKNVAKVVEKVEGTEASQDYLVKVETIQQVQQIKQVDPAKQVPMEGSPHPDPSQSIPRELKQTKELNPLQESKPINPALETQDQDEAKMQPAQPVDILNPAGQD